MKEHCGTIHHHMGSSLGQGTAFGSFVSIRKAHHANLGSAIGLGDIGDWGFRV